VGLGSNSEVEDEEVMSAVIESGVMGVEEGVVDSDDDDDGL